MKTAYLGLATVAVVLLASTTFVRADTLGDWEHLIEDTQIERVEPQGQYGDDPLGLLWDEEGLPFDEEIIMEDGLIVT